VVAYPEDMLEHACPRCSTADAVQAEVFGEGFWGNLGVLALPLAIMAVVAGVLHRMPLRGRGKGS
jgi:hypothetical protein